MIRRTAQIVIRILVPVFASFWLLRVGLASNSDVGTGWEPLWGPSPPLVKFAYAAFPFWFSQVGLLIACLALALVLGALSGLKAVGASKLRIFFVTVLCAAAVLVIVPGVIGIGLQYFQWRHSQRFPWSPTPIWWYLKWSYLCCLHIALFSVPMNVIVFFSAYRALLSQTTTRTAVAASNIPNSSPESRRSDRN
jgi:hypothetical protein